MEQRLISFRRLKKQCIDESDGHCIILENEFGFWKKCTAKNCPVWAKLNSPKLINGVLVL